MIVNVTNLGKKVFLYKKTENLEMLYKKSTLITKSVMYYFLEIVEKSS